MTRVLLGGVRPAPAVHQVLADHRSSTAAVWAGSRH